MPKPHLNLVMKKLVFVILTSCLFFQYCHAQKSKDSLRNLNDYDLGTYYLKQSKQQKTIGWVLSGVGVTLTTVGVIQVTNNLFTESHSGEAAMLAGVISIIATIPLYLSAAKNRRKAKTLLHNQNIPLTHVSGTRLISVGVAIPLRK